MACSTSGCRDVRLLQLDPHGAEDATLDLHPLITVISGADAAARRRIVDAVAALPSASDPGIGGLVEAFGIILDLNVESLALLGLDSDLDVVVRAIDVPSPSPIRSQPMALAIPLLTVEELLDTPEGEHPDLDAARRDQADTHAALEIFHETAERAAEDLAQVTSRRQRVEAALASLQEASERAESGPSTGSDDGGTGFDAVEIGARQLMLESEAADLEVTRRDIDQALDELAAIDTRPVSVLLDAIRQPAEIEWVESERARIVADELLTVQAEMAALEAQLDAEGRGPMAAMARLEAARVALQAAETALVKPHLSGDDVAELEVAHEELLRVEAKRSGLFRRGGQKRIDEARTRQQVILDRVGFPTWSAYVMGAGLLAIDPVAEARLDQARAECEAAENNWADISAMLEADPSYGVLLDRLEAALLEAHDLLGGQEPEDLDRALRELRVPRREVSLEDLVDALAYQLELVGLSFGGATPSVDRAVTVAEAFLAETAGITDRIDELRTQRRAVTARLDAIEGEQMALLVSHPDQAIDLTEGSGTGEGQGEEPQAGSGPGRSDADRSLAGRGELEAELALALDDEQAALDMHDARQALLDAAMRAEAVASSRLVRIAGQLAERTSTPVPQGRSEDSDEPESIELYLRARLTAQRDLSYAGSVPIVIDDAFAGVPPHLVAGVLSQLERMSEAVQIIYLTDDHVVHDWATAAGFALAAVVAAPPDLA